MALFSAVKPLPVRQLRAHPRAALRLATSSVATLSPAARDHAGRHAVLSGSAVRALVIASPRDARPEDELERIGKTVEVVERLELPTTRSGLAAAVSFHRPEVVLVIAPLSEVDFELLRQCSERSIRLLVLARPSYRLGPGASIVRLGGLPWLPVRPLPLSRRQLRAKRILDLGLVLLAAPLLLPMLTLIALATATSSRGGILYRQTRLGRGGMPFVLLKFRTMRADAEEATGPVLAADPDPRVTPVGRLLRRLRLDELPQLWNVLRGEMSLVGPRPERPELARQFHEIPEYEHRHLLPPGLTGIAQLVAGYSATPVDKLRCDLLYVSSRSLRLDLRLIAATLLDLARGFPVG